MSAAGTPNLIAGTADVTIGGTTYQLAGKFTYNTSVVSRSTKTGQDQVHGFGEKPVPPRLTMVLRDGNGLKVSDFNNMTNVDFVGLLANGKTIVGSELWTVDDQTVDTEEGEFPVTFEGMSGSITEN